MRQLLSAIAIVGLAACTSPQPADDAQPVETTPAEPAQTTESAPEPEAAPESASGVQGEMPAADTAEGVAARIAQAHGADAFRDAAEIQFDFAVVNAKEEVFKASHRWDLKGSRARVDWNDKGTPVSAMVSLSDPTQGWVVVDGQPASGADEAKYLKAAHARWVNDGYWLAMPLKVTDEGVNLELLADREVDGKAHKVLKLTFGEVGLTPGDTYWVYADAETYVVSRWDMLLQNAKDGQEPTVVRWEKPITKGGITLHSEHPIEGTPRVIRTPLQAVNSSVDEAAYSAPVAE